MSKEEYDMIIKIVIIGDSHVGKSNLLMKYLRNEFNQESKATVGVEFGSKTFTIDGSVVKVQIWDTAGQDRFKAITKAYYKGAKGAFVVYDITNRNTFNSVNQWVIDLKENSSPNINMMIIGNKNDLEDQRQVTVEEAKQKAIEYSVAFLETSAKTGSNVEKAFEILINDIVKQYKIELEAEEKEEDIEIGDKNIVNLVNTGNKKKKCCQ